MAKARRQDLKKGQVLKITLKLEGDPEKKASDVDITINDFIGAGSTCAVYEGTYHLNGYPVRVIVKELSPNLPEIRRLDDLHLNLNSIATPEFNRRKKQFDDNLEAYRRVVRTPALKVTIPHLIGVGEGTRRNQYQIFEFYEGKSLADIEWEEKSLKERVSVVKKIAEMIKLWSDHDLMLLDLSPDNIAYLEASRSLQFIDFDSLLEKQNKVWRKALSGYRVNEKYLPKALCLAVNKVQGPGGAAGIEQLLHENICHYYLGAQLYYILFPKERDRDICRDHIKAKLGALLGRYPILMRNEAGCGIEEGLLKLLCGLLSDDFGAGYTTLDEIINDFEIVLGLFGKAMDPEVIAQRYEILASNLIEMYPAYKYCSFVDGESQKEFEWDGKVGLERVEKAIDVLIAGDHPMRKALLKYILSCLQMDHVSIRLHLFSYDARSFWEELKTSCPLIGRTCKVNLTGHPGWSVLDEECDRTIVNGELAELFLYPTSDKDQIVERCRKSNIRYIFLLGDDTLNENVLEKLSRDENEVSRFVACLCHKKKPEVACGRYLTVEFLSEESATDALDKELLNNRIYNRGFFVHMTYSLGNNPYASRKRLRAEYDGNAYFQSGSIRPALHAVYKMVSAGIDPESDKAAGDYYQKVLRNDRWLRKQMALEHKSWTAFMIMGGAGRPESVQEIDDYAFRAGMTWKDEREGGHMRHPCIAASRFDSILSAYDWDEFDKLDNMDCVEPFLEKADCDELDKSSMRLHFVVKCRRRECEGAVRACLEDLQESPLYKNDPAFQETVDQLTVQWQSLKSEESAFEGTEDWGDLIETARACAPGRAKIKEIIDNLELAVRPFTKISLRHDFKQSDRDIVNVVPQLFLRTDTPCGKPIGVFSAVRSLTGQKWVDLRAAFYIEPQELILIADGSSVAVDMGKYKDDCSRLLDRCGIETELKICTMSEASRAVSNIYVFWDMTDSYGRCIEPVPRVKQLIQDQKAHKIFFDGEKYISLDEDPYVDILRKHPVFSVRRWMELADCAAIEEGEKQKREKLKVKDTILLWNIMRMLKANGNDWDVFTGMLKRLRPSRIIDVDIAAEGRKKGRFSYEIGTGMLRTTGLRKMLREMFSAGIIAELSFIKDEESEVETVSFTSRFKTLLSELRAICYGIDNYCRVSCTGGADKVRIEYSCRRIKVRDKDLMPDEKRILDSPAYVKLLCEILKQTKRNGRRIIDFRSFTVFDSFEDDRELMKSVIYTECSRKRVFDELVRDVGFERLGEEYHPDLIGIKEGRIYPIFVETRMDVKAFRLKALSLMDGIEGKVIYFVTDGDARPVEGEGDTYSCILLRDKEKEPAIDMCGLRISDKFMEIIKK